MSAATAVSATTTAAMSAAAVRTATAAGGTHGSAAPWPRAFTDTAFSHAAFAHAAFAHAAFARPHVLRRRLDSASNRATRRSLTRWASVPRPAERPLAHSAGVRDPLRHRRPAARHRTARCRVTAYHEPPRARPRDRTGRLHMPEDRPTASVARESAAETARADTAARRCQMRVREHRGTTSREHLAATTEPDRRPAHEGVPGEKRASREERPAEPEAEASGEAPAPEAKAEAKPEPGVKPRVVEPRIVCEPVPRTTHPRIAVRPVAVAPVAVAIVRIGISVVVIGRRTLAVHIGATSPVARRGHRVVDQIVVEAATRCRHRLDDIREHALGILPASRVGKRAGIPRAAAAGELIELEWILRDGRIHRPRAARRGHDEAAVR